MMKATLVTAAVAAALMMPLAGYSQQDKAPPVSRDTAAPAKDSSGHALSDASITTKIKAEYAKDKEVSAMGIRVNTDAGVVTLGGTAKSKAEADKAVTLAKGVQGVTSVKNEIKVEPK